jgi:hypothetical protein
MLTGTGRRDCNGGGCNHFAASDLLSSGGLRKGNFSGRRLPTRQKRGHQTSQTCVAPFQLNAKNTSHRMYNLAFDPALFSIANGHLGIKTIDVQTFIPKKLILNM